MIRLEQISKSFNSRPALQDITFEVAQGEVFGLLGHNGAGKSTTFGVILGQIRPGAGEVFVRGFPVRSERNRALQGVGAVLESPSFYDYLTGWENLGIFASYSSRPDPDEMKKAVELVGLAGRIHEPVRVYSHGMRQRLALAQALVPRPLVVLLDEPVEGLDPDGIHEMRQLIVRLNREHGLTVLLSSHLLAEVEQLCGRVAILHQGRLVFTGNWNENQGMNLHFRLSVDDWSRAGRVITDFGGSSAGQGAVVLPERGKIADLVAKLVHAGVRVNAVEPMRASLEQVYLDKISSK